MQNILLEALPAPKLNAAQKALIRKRIKALNTLRDGDVEEQKETFRVLKRALNANRSSDCKLF